MTPTPTRPSAGSPIVFAAISGAHHRLVGPGANWDLAARTIKDTPLFNNRANASLRWGVLSALTAGAWIASKLGANTRSIGAQARP